MVNENWTKTEVKAFIRKEAQKEVKKHNKKEQEKMRHGYRKIYADHPTVPKCKIEKWVRG
jgi:predicted DNA-binding WGR domain protein